MTDGMPMRRMPVEDLDAIVFGLGERWGSLRRADVLVTGGTGFFGVWLVSALLHANERLGLAMRVHVLARRPEAYLERVPEYRDADGLHLIASDARTFRPAAGLCISHLVHAATPASLALIQSDPAEMAHVSAEGTRNLLSVARQVGVDRFLFTSSGAVYGMVPPEVSHVGEEQMGVLDPLVVGNAYAEGKRLAELYCASYCDKHGLNVGIARCFAFVGPYLPLNTHFAVGNFIENAIRGEPIIVHSDGSPRRSYLYVTDLVTWLLTILLEGARGRAYNVGSEHDVSVGELARIVGAQRGVPVEVRGTPVAGLGIDRYVPSTARARTELQLSETVALGEAIRRTASWCERHRAD